MCSYDPQSYTGGTYIRIDSIDSVSASIASEYIISQYAYATGGASEAKQVKGDNLDKMRYPGPRGWRLAVRLTTPPRQKKKKYCYETSKRKPRSTQGCIADDNKHGGWGESNDINKILH